MSGKNKDCGCGCVPRQQANEKPPKEKKDAKKIK